MPYRFFLLLFLTLTPTLLAAQNIDIVATVNGEPISNYDLQSRMEMIVKTSQLPDTEQTRRRLAGQVLQTLIDETLQRQAAEKAGIEIEERELEAAIRGLEASSNLPEGSFVDSLKMHGVSVETVMEQIRSKLLWQKLLRRELRNAVTISQQEVDEIVDRLMQKHNRTEYNISEIILPIAEADKRKEVEDFADQLVAQLRTGADFGELARQFSASGTALKDGIVGWVADIRLPDVIVEALRVLGPGEVTDPIKMPGEYRIYKLHKRIDPTDATISLQQVFVPYAEDSDQEREGMLAYKQVLDEVAASIASCDEFMEKASTVESELQGNDVFDSVIIRDLGRLKIRDLASEIQQDVARLSVGAITPVLVRPSGLHVLMVCDRSETAPVLPNEGDIRELMTKEKNELAARQYMNELRSKAYISIRGR